MKAAERFMAEHCCDEDDEDDVDDNGNVGAVFRRCFAVDAAALRDDPGLMRDWTTFWDDLEAEGEVVMGILGLAKHQVVQILIGGFSYRNTVNQTHLSQAALEAMKALKGPDHATYPLIRARLSSPPERLMTPISDMRTSLYGRTVSVRGTVVRQSTVRPVCAWLAFECSLCLAVQSVRQPYGYLQEPMTCLNQGRYFMGLSQFHISFVVTVLR